MSRVGGAWEEGLGRFHQGTRAGETPRNGGRRARLVSGKPGEEAQGRGRRSQSLKVRSRAGRQAFTKAPERGKSGGLDISE